MTPPKISSQKITPFLSFDDNAQEAVDFYLSVFKSGRILQTFHYPADMPRPKGTVMMINFELEGQFLSALNAGPMAKFNESISLFVHCQTQAEIDNYWDKLTSQGGSPVACGWLKDRFGVRWQIAPAILPQLLSTPAQCDRVMHAVVKMIKLDIATLKAAAEG